MRCCLGDSSWISEHFALFKYFIVTFHKKILIQMTKTTSFLIL